jgi:uncharacterized protein
MPESVTETRRRAVTYPLMAMEYVPRLADPLIDGLLREFPALLIVGPRAAGKTTTAARHARSTIKLDQPGRAVAVRADPDAAIRDLAEPVLIDECDQSTLIPDQDAS